MLWKFVILCISYYVAGSSANVAPFIHPCKLSDMPCKLNSAAIALKHFADGVPELGIPPIEPLSIKEIVADSGDLKLTFRNVKIYNLSKCKFNSVTRDPVKLIGGIDVECPLLIKGDYVMNGKLFVLEIEGNDVFEIGCGALKIFVEYKHIEVDGADGKKHLKIKGTNYKYEPTQKFCFKFENLFNGDKEKAKPVEEILNESWKELILTVGQHVMKTTTKDVVKIVDKLFDAVPLDELELS